MPVLVIGKSDQVSIIKNNISPMAIVTLSWSSRASNFKENILILPKFKLIPDFLPFLII